MDYAWYYLKQEAQVPERDRASILYQNGMKNALKKLATSE